MAKANLVFLNNTAMEEQGVLDMHKAIVDVEKTYMLNWKGDVINPGKCVFVGRALKNVEYPKRNSTIV